VILACGGNGQVWKPTTNALICTGDGIAMAYRVGRQADGHGDDPVPPDDARRARAS
jgi:succinate dehydrogenase/fumarate reductase flavoprotein subunit